MATKITRDIIESYLNCKYKGHLKLTGESGTQSEYETMTTAARASSREQAIAGLIARFGDGDAGRGTIVTAATLTQGAPLLADADLEDDAMSFRLDALRRADGASKLGDHYYVPVLHTHGDKVGRRERLLLAVLGFTLGYVQGLRPATGLVACGPEGRLGKVRLDVKLYRQAEQVLEEVKRLHEGSGPPRLMLNAHCQVCEFRQRCHTEATAKDDLSLLRGMGEKEIRKCGRKGIFTVTQLSCTFRPRKRSKRSKRQVQPHQRALQALAIREKKIHVLGSPQLPPCPVRIYFDIEGDPERRFDYLLGLIVEADGTQVQYSFWGDSPADESRLFQQVLDVLSRYEDFRLYSYGIYEAAFLRRMMKESGQEEPVKRILANSVNVLSIIYSHVYFPTYANGLKDIGGYLGCRWTEPDASGIQSIVWRRKWEETGSAVFKDKLTTYNLEDCAALKTVTEFLQAICPSPPPSSGSPAVSHEGHEVARVEEINLQFNRREWCCANFAIADFEFINDRAYFDYQRDRVFVRSCKTLQRDQAKRRNRKGKKNLRANQCVEIISPECPFCGVADLTRSQDRRLARSALDLRITRSGMRRWVTRFATSWHHCGGCGKQFLPRDYLRLEEHFHSLKSWAMYEHVAHRTTLANVAETIKECFGLPVFTPGVYTFKKELAHYYEGTYQRLLEKIVGGDLLHADETEVRVKKVGKGYIWIFTNLEEVVFVYRKSREGDFLCDLLKDFRGVLVSDFYAAYDSLGCEQQKCLIHLIRDFNHDILGNPWDEELKALASDFGSLLRTIVATVDQYGLKQRHLGKHRRDVARFFQAVSERLFNSEVAEGYQKRLLKYRNKLFTFLSHDGVPWNNNNAEHAVKSFASYRQMADGQFSETGLNEYLVLLSVYQTCKYKGVSFLKFLLSREKDIDTYRQGAGRSRVRPTVELYPEGFTSPKRSREPGWGCKH